MGEECLGMVGEYAGEFVFDLWWLPRITDWGGGL